MNGDMTPTQIAELRSFFKSSAPKQDADLLTDAVVCEVNHWLRREAFKKIDDEQIKRALNKVDSALAELSSVTTKEGLHFREVLLKAKQEGASPLHKGKNMPRAYYAFNGNDFEKHEAETVRKNSDEAALIWVLQKFWINAFGVTPTKWRGHDFFAMASIVLGKEIDNVFILWNRNGTGNKLD